MSLVMGGELGYQFEPFAAPGNEGYEALVINVIRVPTERHFDPDHVDLPIYAPDNTVRHLILAHPWHGQPHYRVALGHIILRDRKNKVVEAFTCGGNLQIDRYPERTRCCITSPAPIFELVSQMGESSQCYEAILAAELETLLAKRRACWGSNDFAYQQRLAEIDPLLIYASGLYAVEAHLLAMPARSRGVRYRRLLTTVHRAQRAPVLRQVRAESIPALDVLI